MQRWDGPNGLPKGGQEHSLSLISGGYDSPVATWMMMRRGSSVDFALHLGVLQSEHTSVAHALREQGAQAQQSSGVDFQAVRNDPGGSLSTSAQTAHGATADALADRLSTHALITGDSVGHVSGKPSHIWRRSIGTPTAL